MLSNTFETEIFKNISLLSQDQKNKVLAYIKSLVTQPKGSSNKELLQFAGIFNPKDIQEMTDAIEAGCENIDKTEW
jgi:hypothetical protein